MNTSIVNITDEVLHLPVEARIALVGELLKSLNAQTDHQIDTLWIAETEKRAQELDSGMVQPLDGEAVFAEVRLRLRDAA